MSKYTGSSSSSYKQTNYGASSVALPEMKTIDYTVPTYDTSTSYTDFKSNNSVQKPYSPRMGDYSQSAYSASNSGSMTSQNGFSKVQNNGGMQKMSWDGNEVGENKSSGIGYGDALATAQTAGNLWSTWKSNKLAEETFNYNKEMMDKNYALTKDAYERKVRRSDNLNRAQSGELMKTIRRDQSNYNKKTKASRDALED